ncbi:MAG TPA: AraC family transcriptional regulator [Stellaceae bacterium]|nr:AraC family transcriptional regulator [Stellaceae bacterium]
MQGCGMEFSIRSYGGESAHAHDFHQIVLPLLGRMEMRVGGAVGAIAPRCGVLVTGGTVHAFGTRGENRFAVLDVARPGLPAGLLASAAASPFFTIDEPLDHFVRYLASEASCGTLDAAAAYHATTLLAGALGRRIAAAPRHSGAISRVLALIAARYAEPLAVAELAREAGMGASRFFARFRQETGRTPADYIAELRLDRAAILLRDSEASIAAIALAVGFSDQSALTRSFRRRRGTTPAALRRAGRR